MILAGPILLSDGQKYQEICPTNSNQTGRNDRPDSGEISRQLSRAHLDEINYASIEQSAIGTYVGLSQTI